jgi:NAD+ diphosphatase
MYFVCHGNTILQMFDESGSWRPLRANELDVAGEQETHYMGSLGNVACYALDVKDAGGREFANLRANLGRIDSTLFNIAGRALQICDWYRTHRFCGQCGAATDSHTSDRAAVCGNCELRFYPRLSPSIIVLVHREDEVLLGRNHLFPEGLYSTLAGFVEPGESIEETVRREVKEEVGVSVGSLSYRGSQPWPFPNSLMLGFHAEYDAGDIVLQEDEIADAQWFRCDELPPIPGKFAISRWLIDEYLSDRGFPI